MTIKAIGEAGVRGLLNMCCLLHDREVASLTGSSDFRTQVWLLGDGMRLHLHLSRESTFRAILTSPCLSNAALCEKCDTLLGITPLELGAAPPRRMTDD